jgi:hypothetical protein
MFVEVAAWFILKLQQGYKDVSSLLISEPSEP